MPKSRKHTSSKTRGSKVILTPKFGEAGNAGCWFCEHKIKPDYKDLTVLESFVSTRNKILTRQITGTCAKHQRSLSKVIKIARELALLR